MLPFEIKELVLGVISGESRSISRALSLVENNGDVTADKLLQKVYPYGGNSRVVGITGATGVGKSSLICGLARQIRKRGQTVGIISIDPTSPTSGGAFLGDRLRMQELALDSGVFIRSVAGGKDSVASMTRKIFPLMHVMEASGKHFVFIETMGSGQDDCLISKVAQTTLYVTIPDLGDEIQAMKAGVVEAADAVVVNKADSPNKDKAVASWKNIITMDTRKHGAWKVPVLTSNSLTGEGIDAIVSCIDAHERHMKDSGEWERRKKDSIREEVKLLALSKLRDQLEFNLNEKEMGALLERRSDPLVFVDKFLKKRR
ncbi:MAG: methylmalonyl Co-A mutase-associated GTPase MeaB [Elusimicrobiota bacterium]